MKTHGVEKLIYSSTCATYGEPETMPITESTPQVPYSICDMCFVLGICEGVQYFLNWVHLSMH